MRHDATHHVRLCRWWSYRSAEERPADSAGGPIPDVSALRADSFDWGLRIMNFGLECPRRIRILFLLSVTKDAALRKWVDYHRWWGLSLWRSRSQAGKSSHPGFFFALQFPRDSAFPSLLLSDPSRKARPHTFQPMLQNRCCPTSFIPSLTGLRYNSSAKDKKNGIGDIAEPFF